MPKLPDVLILAAGQASRMGQAKQLLPIEGKPMLLRVIEIAQEFHPPSITVVLGSYADSIQKALANNSVATVVNTQWKTGMGSSIRTGVEFIRSQFDSAGILVLLADQPLIHNSYLQQLYQAWQIGNKKIIASKYANTFGVPAVFDCSIYPDLLTLSDQQGAKKLIQKYLAQEAVELLPFAEGSIDLDTPEDYQNFIKNL